ncbi:UNVERIFIED_CONTAM: holin-like protein [Paenibacillus sp. PvR008]
MYHFTGSGYGLTIEKHPQSFQVGGIVKKEGRCIMMLPKIRVRKIVKIAAQLALLYVFSYFGELLHNWLDLPIPGSITGLLLLLLALCTRILPVRWIEVGAGFLLAYLPFLFIPANVGVMNYASLLSGTGVLMLVIIVVSTLMTLLAAGLTGHWLNHRAHQRREAKECLTHSSPSL